MREKINIGYGPLPETDFRREAFQSFKENILSSLVSVKEAGLTHACGTISKEGFTITFSILEDEKQTKK